MLNEKRDETIQSEILCGKVTPKFETMAENIYYTGQLIARFT